MKYCEQETLPAYYRYPWGEVYRPVGGTLPSSLEPSRFAFFLDEASAEASGLRPPKKVAGRPPETGE